MSSPSETQTTIPEETAKSRLGESAPFGLPTLNFTRTEEYTTFIAEHGTDVRDLVFHFFKAPEHAAADYWQKDFPAELEAVAMRVFDATYPRLKAAFTGELDSWWLRANGFAEVGDPEARVEHFYKELDQALEARIASQRAV